jgi:hypothetical protein
LNIINNIKAIEKYKPAFKKEIKYNPFYESNTVFNTNTKTRKISGKKLILNAIFQNIAYINGIALKKGDFIQGYEIIKITPQKVFLKKDGELKILSYDSKILKVTK